tara:strand:+ start:2014 stop:2610 length:597 start_codon:yes stop_codon:yes gene_type:complete
MIRISVAIAAAILLAGAASAQETCETLPDPENGWSMGYLTASYSQSPGYYIEHSGDSGLAKRGPIETSSSFRIRLVDGVAVDTAAGARRALGQPQLELLTGAMTDPRTRTVATALSHKAALITNGETGTDTYMSPASGSLAALFPLPIDADGQVTAATLGVQVCLNGNPKNCTAWTFDAPQAALTSAAAAFDASCTEE